jgi:hypothetical protein
MAQGYNKESVSIMFNLACYSQSQPRAKSNSRAHSNKMNTPNKKCVGGSNLHLGCMIVITLLTYIKHTTNLVFFHLCTDLSNKHLSNISRASNFTIKVMAHPNSLGHKNHFYLNQSSTPCQ